MTDTVTSRRSALQIIAILLAVVVQIGATYLPALGIGENIGSRSDDVRTLITPSGWAFAIWGPLFLGSIFYAIWQALPGQRDNPLLGRIGWWSVGGLSAQGIWAVYTQSANLTFVSAIIILFSLVCLLAIMREVAALHRLMTTGERWLVGLLFTALAAWLTAASIVNISAAMVYHGVDLGDAAAVVTAGIVIVGGIIAAIAVARSRGAPWYAMVFLWALLAIYFRGGQEAAIIGYACIASAVLVAGTALSRLTDKGNRRFWTGW